jgi:SM-20-related protein
MAAGNAEHFRLMIASQFFDKQFCRDIINDLRMSQATPAPVYGTTTDACIVDNHVRKVMRVIPSNRVLQVVTERLTDELGPVNAHFQLSLTTCEDPQFLRYRTGDFFVAHQDGNTGLIKSEREDRRKISVVIFLNDPSGSDEDGGYAGGELHFTDWRQHKSFSMTGEQGTLVAFPAETTHEVAVVTRGERFSIVSWYG